MIFTYIVASIYVLFTFIGLVVYDSMVNHKYCGAITDTVFHILNVKYYNFKIQKVRTYFKILLWSFIILAIFIIIAIIIIKFDLIEKKKEDDETKTKPKNKG